MYARNLAAFVCHLFDDEGRTNPEDEITAATCVTRDGEVVNERAGATPAGAAEQQR